jgi:multidrug efflux pump subunit AcrB
MAYFVSHRTAANLLLILVVLAGGFASTKIRAQFFPDVVIEVVSVSVGWSGVGPEEVDKAIVARLEPRLRGIDGVDKIIAVAREGVARIRLEFEDGTDMAEALDEVRATVNDTSDLPADADEPAVRRIQFRDRVTDVLIIGPVSVGLLKAYAEELRSRLYKAGATRASVVGVSAPEITVELSPQSLERYRLRLADVAQAIGRETGTEPIGELREGSARVRVDSARESVASIEAVTLRAGTNGTRLRVGDVAHVREEPLDGTVALYRNAIPAVRVTVERGADGDAIKMQALVEREVAAMAATLPKGIEMTLARTRSEAIRARLSLLLKNGALGLAIVLVLLFLFLSARAAFWVAAGIPVAMAATVALMFAFGFTLNMVSLFALIICLGIVVDDAIVVGEYADQLAAKGYGPRDAAIGAAVRMSGPVLSASITTVIAFGALVLIGGRFGRLIYDLPFTVCVVVLASLVECFLILPAHMRHALNARTEGAWLDAPSRWVNRGFDKVRERLFIPLIESVVRLRYPVIALGVLTLAVAVSAIIDNTVRWRFFVAPERGTVTANIAMLPGATRADTLAMLRSLDSALDSVAKRYEAKYGRHPVELAIAKVGGTTGRGLSGADTIDPDRLGGYDISLIDPDERPYSALDFIYEWRSEIPPNPKLQTLALRRGRSGPSGNDIHVRLQGDDSQQLKRASVELQARLARFDSVSGLEDDLAYDKPELLIKLTARGAALGFTTADVARQLRERLDGVEATSFARGSDEVKVNVRLAERYTGPEFLDGVTLVSPSGTFVSLSAIASVSEQQGFSVIRRDDGARVVTITGELEDDSSSRDAVNLALAEDILPQVQSRYGVAYTYGGLAEQEAAFLTDATNGLILCLFGIYLALAWVFSSWSRPLVILLMVPFGLIGAVLGHHVHSVPLSMFSVIGMIGMSGIIINDSIVLVTTVDERLRTQGILRAVADGTADRLRAVLLTTLTTVGGLAPLLFEQSRQAAFLQPTVITLVYGLGFGMILVLILTPATLAAHQDIRRAFLTLRRFPRVWLRWRRRRARSRLAQTG